MLAFLVPGLQGRPSSPSFPKGDSRQQSGDPLVVPAELHEPEVAQPPRPEIPVPSLVVAFLLSVLLGGEGREAAGTP